MKPENKPNILLIFTDQQRFDTIHALGNPVIKTPSFDRLCNNGVAFTSAFSPSPVCVPARCALTYGQYPMTTSCYENGYRMPDDRESYIDVLAKEGYRTHGIGKCHFTPDKFAMRGFQTREVQEEVPERESDDYTKDLEKEGWGALPEPHGVRGEMYYVPQVSQLPARLHPTQWIGDRSVAFIEEQTDSDQPWMLKSSYIHPHPPFAPPSPWHKLYRSFDMPLPKVPQDAESLHTYINKVQNRYKGRDQGIDNNLMRNMKAHYYACISFIDFQVGRILESLEKTGQLDNTLILLGSDHGDLLGDYNCVGKRSMHDSAARVPLIISQPGRFEGGKVCNQAASLVDIMPTFLGAAGCDTTGLNLDGVDLHGFVTGEQKRDTVYMQHQEKEDATYAMVNERWKYVYSAPDNQAYLFDRITDPEETRNKVDLPSTRDVSEALRKEAMRFFVDGGESEATEGDNWKVYSKQDISSNPDAGFIFQDRPGYVLDLPGYTD